MQKSCDLLNSEEVRYPGVYCHVIMYKFVLCQSCDHTSAGPPLSSTSTICTEQIVYFTPSRLKWLKSGGMIYRSGSVMVLQNALLLSFGEIVDILVYNVDQCLFVVKKITTVCFLVHYHAYEVSQNPSTYLVCTLNDFIDHHPLSLHTLSLSNTIVIPFKYHIIETF